MKFLAVILISLFTTYGFAETNILMMVSEGFYAPEYYKPLKAFKSAGFKVTTAAKYKSPVKPDRRQIDIYQPVQPDLIFNEITPEEYDAIVFAGGNGAWEDFFPNEKVHKILTQFLKNDKVTALLCSATGLLGVANNLDGSGAPLAKGRNVTGYKRVKGLLTELGKVKFSSGNPKKPYVVVDKNLITGRDPISSALFAETVVKELKKRN